MNRIRHFVTTWPRKNHCHRCGRLTLDGLDEGLPYRIDPAPLTTEGELIARFTGNNTYRLLAAHIVARTIENITTETPTTRPPVYATHQCEPINPHHIVTEHIPNTQALITDKYLDTATPEQDTDQQALITITDVLNGKIIESPDDESPPF